MKANGYFIFWWLLQLSQEPLNRQRQRGGANGVCVGMDDESCIGSPKPGPKRKIAAAGSFTSHLPQLSRQEEEEASY
jgi:hypothetical protein